MLPIEEESRLISDLFTQAAAQAKEHDKIQPEFTITEEMMFGYLKQAFPKISDESAKSLAHKMFIEEPAISNAE